ncbi:conserved Plasmodium protein, unknown function [Plasmodium chabaudi adami]|uniref:Dynein intermediate chain n=1 Tax=Plasmodium chabaudi adami TaxID=5826 RepID=A0A1C6XH99_PLACE|nr:conserved Plasmodium protein, unknown function [Plasmodium chabaudi adami]
MKTKNTLPIEKHNKKDNEKKEYTKKKKIMTKKKIETDIKNKLEKITSKNEKESDEKKTDNYYDEKSISVDKKHNPIKNKTLIDLTEFFKETEDSTSVNQCYKNNSNIIRAINIELERNIQNVLEIDFSNDLNNLIFLKDTDSIIIKKSYIFSLFPKYFNYDEFIIIKDSLSKYNLDDVLIFKNTKKYYTKKNIIITDEEVFTYFLKNKNFIESPEQKNEEIPQIEEFQENENLKCVFINPKNYISPYEKDIEKEIYSTKVVQSRKKLKKYIYINKEKKGEQIEEFVNYNKFLSISGNLISNGTLQQLTLDFCSKNYIIHEEKSTQTYKAVHKNIGIQYNIEFLKKKKEEILKSNKINKYLHKILPLVEKSMIENIIISEQIKEPNNNNIDILSYKNIKYLNKIFIYTDIKYTTDKVALFTLSLPHINYLIFIIYVNNYKNTLQIEGVNTDSYILIWSYSNYMNPLYALISPYQISTAIVNEKDNNMVIAGSNNGLLIIWKLPPNYHEDFFLNSKTNEKTIDVEPYLFSCIEESHRREVTSLIFLSDKTLIISEKKISINTQKNSHLLLSVSVDGIILIWNATNIERVKPKTEIKKKDIELADELYSFKPIFKINITRPNTEYSLGFTYFHFLEINSHTSQFFAFSEEGEYVIGNIYNCMQKDKNFSIVSEINSDYKNFKTLLSIKRNNIIKNLILTLTDHNFYLWKEDEKHPFFISPKSNEIYSCCEFSQTKISVIYIGKTNGHIEIWNLLEQKKQCIHSVSISNSSLICISILQNTDPSVLNSFEKKNNISVENNNQTNYDDENEIIDTNDYLRSKNEDDAYKYSYNKIIIGDSNGCVYVYQMEQNLLTSTKEETDEFILWMENQIYVNKQKTKRQFELCKEKDEMLKKDIGDANERKEQLETKLNEDFKKVMEKYKNYLLGNKL